LPLHQARHAWYGHLPSNIKHSKLVSLQNSDASEDSQYRKLQRYFLQWVFPWVDISKTILNKIPKPKNGYMLEHGFSNQEKHATPQSSKRDKLNVQ
jgi:hypothetical protein